MRRYTSRGRIVSYFEDAPVAVRLLPKGAAALVPCDRAQFLSHFQKFHISCTKVRMRACVRALCVRRGLSVRRLKSPLNGCFTSKYARSLTFENW